MTSVLIAVMAFGWCATTLTLISLNKGSARDSERIGYGRCQIDVIRRVFLAWLDAEDRTGDAAAQFSGLWSRFLALKAAERAHIPSEREDA